MLRRFNSLDSVTSEGEGEPPGREIEKLYESMMRKYVFKAMDMKQGAKDKSKGKQRNDTNKDKDGKGGGKKKKKKFSYKYGGLDSSGGSAAAAAASSSSSSKSSGKALEYAHHYSRDIMNDIKGKVSKARQRRLNKELKALKRDLPLHIGSSAVLRVDSTRPFIMQVGEEKTPGRVDDD